MIFVSGVLLSAGIQSSFGVVVFPVVLMGLRWRRKKRGKCSRFEDVAFEVAVGKDDTSVGARPGASAAVLDAFGAALEMSV
jgi:hypothetical protein